MFSSTCAIKFPKVISEPRGCNYFNFYYNPLNDCCNQHDACYRSCTIPKQTCDSDYEKCVHGVCGNMMDILGAMKLTYDLVKWGSSVFPAAVNPQARILFLLNGILEHLDRDIKDLTGDTTITCNLVTHLLMKNLSCEEFKSIIEGEVRV